jgi:long-chain fatty acid transport protein
MTKHRGLFPRTAAFAAAGAMLLLVASDAAAGGFAVARFGGESAHPANGHPTSIYFNPAGLSLEGGTRLYAEGLFAYRTATYDRPEGAIDNVVPDGTAERGTPQEAVDANSGQANLANMIAAPFGAVVSDLGVDNLGVGIGVYAPFGGQAKWDQNDDYAGSTTYAGAVDGVQRWSTIDGILQALYITGAASYTLPGPRLSFGVSASLVRNKIETVRARTLAGTDDLVGANGAAIEGRSLIEVSSDSLALGAGVIWQPTNELWIGASYQSQPGLGEQKLAGTLTNKFGPATTDVSDVLLLQELPDVVRVGVRYDMAPIELRLQGDYTRWSVFENQCLVADTEGANCALSANGATLPEAQDVIVNVRRDFKDTFGVRAGASYAVSKVLDLGGSLAYDSNAVPANTIDAALMDMDKVIANVGLGYRLLDAKLRLSANLLQVLYVEREVSPRLRDSMGVPVGFDPPSSAPDGAGTYSQSVTVLSLGAGYSF